MYKIIGADQKEYGPVTADQLRQWVAEGRVSGQTSVWSEGAGEWKALSAFPEFADLLADKPPVAGAPRLMAPNPACRRTFSPATTTWTLADALPTPGTC